MHNHSMSNDLPTLERTEAAMMLGDGDPTNLIYISWPELFGSTTGPFGGIGGQAMTWFRMEAWINTNQEGLVFCNGKKVSRVSAFKIRTDYDVRS